MNKTTDHITGESTITVDINGLMQLLCCGEHTARRIANNANAKVPIEGKRTLYSVDRVREYVLKTTAKENSQGTKMD